MEKKKTVNTIQFMKNEKLFALLSAYIALGLKLKKLSWNIECYHFTKYCKKLADFLASLSKLLFPALEMV